MTIIKYSETVSTTPVEPKPVVPEPKPTKVSGNEQTSKRTETTKIIKNGPTP